ncbi:MAG: HEAT repeat domain-containing protein [Nitrospirota bacterium]
MAYKPPKEQGSAVTRLKGYSTIRNGIWPVFSIIVILWVFHTAAYGDDLLEATKKALTTEDWQTRLAAVERLVRRNDQETVSFLIRLAENRNEDWRVQRKAIQLLGEAGDPRAIDLLTFVLHSNTSDWKCPALQSAAATALGSFPGNNHVQEVLIEGTRNRELIIREASITSLGKIRAPEAIPHLLPFLRDKNIAIRHSTISALVQIGDPAAVSSLREVAGHDNDAAVREAAKRAVKSFDHTNSNQEVLP